MIIPILETLLLIWVVVGLIMGAVYLDNKDRITKRYKHIAVSVFGGPVVWAGWLFYLFAMTVGKFENWLRT